MKSYVNVKVSLLKTYISFLNRPKMLQKEVNKIIQGAEATMFMDNLLRNSDDIKDIEVIVPIEIMIDIQKEVQRYL